MKKTESDVGSKYEYKCGKLSEVVITSLKKFLKKIEFNGLKRTVELFLPGIDLDEFVLQKIKNQMKKRRAVELSNGLGRVDIQYRRGGIQIEPAGILRLFVKEITITDNQILSLFHDIISQVENQYIYNDNYIVSKIDDIIFKISKTGIYSPKNSEEKTFYDFAMIILANYYGGSDETPEWVDAALGNIASGEFIERWIEFLAEYMSEVIAQVSENIFFDFKFTFDSALIRAVLNQKTNKGQLSKLIKLFGINIKSIIHKFVESYVSPSFLRGAGDIISDMTCGFLSDVGDGEESLNMNDCKVPDGIFDLTVALSELNFRGRAFRWYSKNKTDFKLEYSYNCDFERLKSVDVQAKRVMKTFPKINLGLVSSYKAVEVFEYSVNVENLEQGEFYYRIVSDDFCTQKYKMHIGNQSQKTKFLIFADSQGMVKSDYDKFLNVFENSISKNLDADFLVHLGDFVDDGNNEECWNWVLSSKKWAEIPALALSGNHEARRNIVAHRFGVGNSVLSHFNLPIKCDQNSEFGAYYSVVYGDVTLIALNTNTGGDYGIDKCQYDWAINTAKNAKTKWKVLLTHKSPYSNGPHHKDLDVKLIGKQIDDIAYYGNIDLVLGGHDHVYARTPVLAQGHKVFEYTKKIVYKNFEYESYINPQGTIFVVPGTSGVKNYQQKFPAGFHAKKLLGLDKPVYSCVEIDNENLYFDAFTFDEISCEFSRIDSFCIQKSAHELAETSAEYLDKFIDSIPDIPWKDHSEQIQKAKKIYENMDNSEKIKVQKRPELLKFSYFDECRKSIDSGKVAKVSTLAEFLKAIEDKSVGNIVIDSDEIDFENNHLPAKKIYIDRALKISGSGKLTHVRFVLKPGAFVIIAGSVCIDDTRKPYSVYPSLDVFEMHSSSFLALTEDATVNSGYGVGKGGRAINIIGDNSCAYLSTSGHNFARNGFVFTRNNTSNVKVTSGKYISNSRRYTFDINGKINISSGFIRSLKIDNNGEGVLEGGTLGDSQRSASTYPLECLGKMDIYAGTINAHKEISVKVGDAASVIEHKKSNCIVDIKGKILYN